MTSKFSVFIIASLFFAYSIGYGQETSISEKCLTNHESNDRYASFSPNGEHIIFESDRNESWDIYLMKKDGSDVRRLTNDTSNNRRPSWHPRGRKVLFESSRNNDQQLYEIDVNSRDIKQISNIDNGMPIFASYSPNGDAIAVSLKLSEMESKIILLSVDDSNQSYETIVSNNFRNFYPKWHPEGNKLIFFSRKDTDNEDDELYSIDLAQRQIKRLTNWPKHNFCPNWSADGNKIAYVTSMEKVRPEIFVMKADGSDSKRITFNDDGETLPTWHPYENKLLVTAYRGGNFEICEIILR